MAPQQDGFMDDTDDCCPLCVEELDVQDKEFHPCECGYQICQFCFNNIRTNMNGLCPACRRPYVDEKIKWKVFSPEELKADVAAAAKRKAAARQKEAERRQVESQNRKHLAGLRVVQKNLVYVVGMNLTGVDHSDILATLRGPQHFGQYGEIVKIVVSKAKTDGQPLGIYVTFARKEDAATCISVLDGQSHDGRTLRAQYGTTKYCSAYLRGERCNNRHCMFLHETGEDSDSFSRQDLSSYNALGTQRKNDPANQANQSQAPPQQAPQTIAAASQFSEANNTKGDAMSRSDSGEGSALPTTANWAKNPQIEQSRRSSQAASRATPSPKVSSVKPVISRPQSRLAQTSQASAEVKGKAKEEPAKPEVSDNNSQEWDAAPTTKSAGAMRLDQILKKLSEASFTWSLDRSLYDSEALAMIDNLPPLIDPNGGSIRLALKIQQEKERAKQEDETNVQILPDVGEDENLMSGSLQLGGEPETTDQSANGRRPQASSSGPSMGFDGTGSSLSNEFDGLSLAGKRLTPQQQRNAAILRSGTATSGDNFQGQGRGASQHQSQLSNPFQSQNQQLNPISRHGRQTSRYTFANDNPSAAAVKPSSNSQLLAQQSSGVQGQQKPFTSQPSLQSSLYSNNYSNVQGPPPGLKSSGTPPISGGGMFGQGHGFASAMGGSLSYGANNIGMKGGNDELVRDIIRGRGTENSKADITDPSIVQARIHHGGVGQGFGGTQGQDPFLDDLTPSHPPPGFGPAPGLYQNIFKDKTPSGSRPGTPAVPPGLALPSEFPPLAPTSKPPTRKNSVSLDGSSHLETKRTSKSITPSLPQPVKIPSTPASKPPAEDKSSTSVVEDHHDSTISAIGRKDQPMSQGQKSSKSAEAKSGVSKKGSKGKSKEKKSSVSEPLEKRQVLDALDIGAARDATKEQFSLSASPDVAKPETPRGEVAAPVSATLSHPQTPATVVSQTSSPAIKHARTLRLITTPKTEVPSAVGSGSSSQQAPQRIASRQASVASFNQSETPVRDSTPDNFSSTSASVSRPVSPHPASKVGSAPVRQKTKSQAKKDRQARAKAEEEKIVEKIVEKQVPRVEEEPVQAPIVGRKKKAKKPAAESAPKVAQAPSQKNVEVEKEESPHPATEPKVVVEEPVRPAEVVEKIVETTEQTASPAAAQSAAISDSLPEPKSKPITPGSVLADLKGNDELYLADFESLVTVPAFNHRFDPASFGVAEHKLIPSLTRQQLEVLENGNPVIVEVSSQECAVVLPDHSVLRHLSLPEAEKYLRLRQSVAQSDPDFLKSSRLPYCMSMKDTWDEFSSYGPSLSGQDLTYTADSEELAKYYASSVLRVNESLTLEEGWQPRSELGNEDLVTTIEAMTLQEAEVALKRSDEDVVGMAKKDADAMEKKLNQILKKNRKVLREVLGN